MYGLNTTQNIFRKRHLGAFYIFAQLLHGCRTYNGTLHKGTSAHKSQGHLRQTQSVLLGELRVCFGGFYRLGVAVSVVVGE